jgi:hypothetical protein
LFASWGDRLAGRQPANPVKVSIDVLEIFGKIEKKTARPWQVSLGLAQKEQEITLPAPSCEKTWFKAPKTVLSRIE